MLRIFGSVLLSLIATNATAAGICDVLPKPRLQVFISDMHFGPGPRSAPPYHPYEDFRWGKELSAFLKKIDQEGGGRTDLILNGDTFELWQPVDAAQCTSGRSADDGCTEQESRERIRVTLEAHAADLGELKKFADSGSNRLIIVPGNHDAALLFEKVRKDVIAAIGAKEGRVEIPADGYYLSCDKKVYAEHGHQLDDSNALSGWPVPFRGPRRYLARPWGENFVASFYNRRELSYEAIDNIAGTWNGIRYGLATEELKGSVRAVGQFSKFLLVGQSIKQFSRVLSEQSGDQNAQAWDIKAIRTSGERFLVESIPTDDPSYEVVEAAYKEGLLGLTTNLSDTEIRDICDVRYAINLQQQADNQPITVQLCQREKLLLAMGKKVASLIDKHMFLAAHIDDVYAHLQEDKRLSGDETFEVVVLSHSHQVEEPFDPNAFTFRAWRPKVVNTGAWQRIGTKADVVRLTNDNQWSKGDVLRKLKPEMLPDCYSAVLVRAADPPDVRLMWWEKVADTWVLRPNSESDCHR